MLDLEHLVTVLHREEVSWVAVGGVAVGVHGYVRMTLDLDLVPAPDHGNLARLVAALSRLSGSLPAAGGRPFDPARDAGTLRRGGNLSLDTPFGGVDVIQRLPGTPTWEELFDAAEEVQLGGVGVLICSLGHLRAMKATADRPQDRADLAALPSA